MSAPTEAEIRAAIEARFADDQPDDVYRRFKDSLHGVLDEVVAYAADPLVESAANTLEIRMASTWEPLPSPAERSLWVDLRPTEAAELMELVRSAKRDVVAHCQAAIVDAIVQAGVAFAEKHPDLARTDVVRQLAKV